MAINYDHFSYSCCYLVSSVQPVNSSQLCSHIISRCVSLTWLHGIDFGASMGSFSGAPWASLPRQTAQNEPGIGGGSEIRTEIGPPHYNLAPG